MGNETSPRTRRETFLFGDIPKMKRITYLDN